MSYLSKLSVAFAIFLFPLSAAAAPGNVGGIEGEVRGGKAHVSWQKPGGEAVVSYRVFYSRASILQQNGLYDDFETVKAPATEYTFESLPYQTNTLYVSVLAVNANGDESPLFMEEARIDFTNAPVDTGASSSAAVSSKAASSVAAQNPVLNSTIQMLAVKAISATGATVTFSSEAEIDGAKAAQAFVIKDASGSLLRITRLVIQGKEVTLITVKQERGRVYRLEASADAVKGKNNLKLDPQQGAILFLGHETGAPLGSTPTNVPSSQPSQQQVSSAAAQASSMPVNGVGEDVRSLQLRGQVKGNAYTVEATWQTPATGTVKEYRVAQSRDRGRTYSQPQIIPGGANGVKIENITGGDFGINIQTVYADGTLSRGTFQTITLPVKGGSTLPGNVIGPIQNPNKPANAKPTNGGLSNSGMEMAVPALISAAGAGYEVWRRRKLAAKAASMVA